MYHLPVLPDEVVRFVEAEQNDNIVDCTLGCGGHALRILKKYDYSINYYGIDCDKNMLKIAKDNLSEYKTVRYISDNFKNYDKIIEANNLFSDVKTCIFDLGVNSLHLDTPDRGFSFRFESSLDMRLNQEEKLTAYDVVNNYSERELADVIYKYGEERLSRRIAKNIVEERKKIVIKTTTQLADIILKSFPYNPKSKHKIHPATRTFQAIRIEVNKELKDLDKILRYAAYSLKKSGRLIVISFHSLEDRIVKNVFRYLSTQLHQPPLPEIEKSKFIVLTKKPIIPDCLELKINSRARSSKMRVIEKIC